MALTNSDAICIQCFIPIFSINNLHSMHATLTMVNLGTMNYNLLNCIHILFLNENHKALPSRVTASIL